MDLNDMLKEAQKLQKDMEDIQRKLETEECSVSNSTGTITAVITGANKFTSFKLKEEIKNLSIEELQNEILNVAEKATEMARKKHEEAMKQITASLSLPSLDEIKSIGRRTPSSEEPPRLSV